MPEKNTGHEACGRESAGNHFRVTPEGGSAGPVGLAGAPQPPGLMTRRMVEARTELPRWMPADRRAGHDRRLDDRRRSSLAVSIDRRAGGDRRRIQRRSGVERRGERMESGATQSRQTLLPYSRDDAARLKSGLSAGDLTCPSCGQTVTRGPRITRGGRSVREYRCINCRKGMMFRGS